MTSYYEDEDAAGKIYDARIFKRLGGYLRPYLKQLAIVLVVGVIVAALHITGPLIVRYAIDNQISEGRDDKLRHAGAGVHGRAPRVVCA